jgi:type II restriction enzyme
MVLGLTTDGAREGNDAVDVEGNEYEIKTVNAELTTQFSTHHHMNPVIITKYRKVDWYFAVFKNIELQAIYRLQPSHMEPYYQRWWEKWHADGQKDINNPKIPLTHVMKHGSLVWLPENITEFALNQESPFGPFFGGDSVTITVRFLTTTLIIRFVHLG